MLTIVTVSSMVQALYIYAIFSQCSTLLLISEAEVRPHNDIY